MRICKHCGKSFEPLHHKSVYCSPECAKRAKYAYNACRAKAVRAEMRSRRANSAAPSVSIAQIVNRAREECLSYGQYIQKQSM